MRVFDAAMFSKTVLKHDIGLGEAFMDGDFEVDSLGGLIAVLVANAEQIELSRGQLGILNWVGGKLSWLQHIRRANTVQQAKLNISDHYDAGNAMYK